MSTAKVPLSMVADYYTPALTNFLEQLSMVSKQINVIEMVTPTNFADARKAWLEMAALGRWTNPRFRYDRELLAGVAELDSSLAELRETMPQALATMSRDEIGQALCGIVTDRLEEVETEIALARFVHDGDDLHAETAVKLIYGEPNSITVSRARQYAKELREGGGYIVADSAHLQEVRRRLDELTLSAEDIREVFIWMAKRLNIAETRPVEISDKVTDITVRDKSSRGAAVLIPSERTVSGSKLVQLCSHEVVCHWLDSERAQKALPLLGGGALKPNEETLHEGRAVLADYIVRLTLGDRAQRQQFPFYVLGIALAASGCNFWETAKELYMKLRPLEESDSDALAVAWRTCYRIFRGSSGDQNNYQILYAFPKDRAYFEGRLLANHLHQQELDSILEISTLSWRDIERLQPVVDFGLAKDAFDCTKLHTQRLVSHLLKEEVAL